MMKNKAPVTHEVAAGTGHAPLNPARPHRHLEDPVAFHRERARKGPVELLNIVAGCAVQSSAMVHADLRPIPAFRRSCHRRNAGGTKALAVHRAVFREAVHERGPEFSACTAALRYYRRGVHAGRRRDVQASLALNTLAGITRTKCHLLLPVSSPAPKRLDFNKLGRTVWVFNAPSALFATTSWIG